MTNWTRRTHEDLTVVLSSPHLSKHDLEQLHSLIREILDNPEFTLPRLYVRSGTISRLTEIAFAARGDAMETGPMQVRDHLSPTGALLRSIDFDGEDSGKSIYDHIRTYGMTYWSSEWKHLGVDAPSWALSNDIGFVANSALENGAWPSVLRHLNTAVFVADARYVRANREDLRRVGFDLSKSFFYESLAALGLNANRQLYTLDDYLNEVTNAAGDELRGRVGAGGHGAGGHGALDTVPTGPVGGNGANRPARNGANRGTRTTTKSLCGG